MIIVIRVGLHIYYAANGVVFSTLKKAMQLLEK